MRDWTAEELDRIGAADADHAAIDRAYQTEHARYGSSYVDPMVSPNATAAALRTIAR